MKGCSGRESRVLKHAQKSASPSRCFPSKKQTILRKFGSPQIFQAHLVVNHVVTEITIVYRRKDGFLNRTRRATDRWHMVMNRHIAATMLLVPSCDRIIGRRVCQFSFRARPKIPWTARSQAGARPGPERELGDSAERAAIELIWSSR